VVNWFVTGSRYSHEMISHHHFHALRPREGWLGHCRVLPVLLSCVSMYLGLGHLKMVGRRLNLLASVICNKTVMHRYSLTLCNWIACCLSRLSPRMLSIMCQSCCHLVVVVHGLLRRTVLWIECRNCWVVSSHSALLHGRVHVSCSIG